MTTKTPTRPNVLLIMTDQQRVDTLGFRRETPCRTPNIDRIAAEGVSFDQAITPFPLCLPSRAAVFSGLHPTRNNMMDNATGYLEQCQTLQLFRANGYQVNYAGKWHLGEGNIGRFTDRHAGDSTVAYSDWCRAQGLIDGWMFNDPATRTHRSPSMSTPATYVQDLPPDKTNEAYVTGFAIDMIRSRDTSRPFFQVCSYNGPHPPFVIPEPYYSLYEPGNVARPANFGPLPGELAVNRTSYYRQLFNDHGADFDRWRESYAVYWGFVTMIDEWIGSLIGAVEDEGLIDNTIIVFLSDHGENLGAHGLWHKMVPYEESIRVPFLIRPPGEGRVGLRSDAPASLIDVLPTLAALCGLPSSPDWAGVDLSAALAGEPACSSERPLFAMHKPLGDWMAATDWRMIERSRWKYVWYRDVGEELFDLDEDPFEMSNLADEAAYAQRKNGLRQALGEFLNQSGDPLASHWPF
ncbi:MAG: sulfatase-like hydrolase/transferase [Hyphomicrobiales bacterium]|nr:sulfatase-like hydrolase/transferase [Hyphomicrobiales bacterium]